MKIGNTNIVNIVVEFDESDYSDEWGDYHTYGILKMNDIPVFKTEVNFYSEPSAVEEVIEKFARHLERASMHTEPEMEDKVAVRKEIRLFGNPIYLCDQITEFLIMCRYDEEAEYKIKGNVMYLEGSRPLLASEVLDVQKGLFDDDL